MMKSAILASCLAAAAAFAPAQTGKASTALNSAFDGEIGAASAGESSTVPVPCRALLGLDWRRGRLGGR